MVVAEMARRKVQFHKDEDWRKVKLWGLFRYAEIKKYIEQGDLILYSSTEFEPHKSYFVWVYPSRRFWINEINPAIKKYTLEDLTICAGW